MLFLLRFFEVLEGGAEIFHKYLSRFLCNLRSILFLRSPLLYKPGAIRYTDS